MNVPKSILGMTWVEFAMVLIGFSALVIELVAYFTNKSSVISVVMRSDGRRWLWEPFLFGLLPGHFYCPALPWHLLGWESRPWWFPAIWILMAVGLVVRDLFFPAWAAMWAAYLAFLLGQLGGAVFWNQG